MRVDGMVGGKNTPPKIMKNNAFFKSQCKLLLAKFYSTYSQRGN